MSQTPDSQPAEASSQAAAPTVSVAKPARPGLRDQIADNPLLTFLGTVVVALLVFTLTGINSRIDGLGDRFDGLEDRFDRLEDKVDAGFAAQGDKIEQIDRKLTALVAALNATEAVDAALEGRLLGSDAGGSEPGGAQAGQSEVPSRPRGP